MQAPEALVARTSEQAHPLIAAGATLPARARVVCATQRPGQRELELELVEGEAGRRVARVSFALPAGLPANCWIPVEVRVDAELRVSASAREQLRRIQVEGRLDATGATARAYRAAE